MASLSVLVWCWVFLAAPEVMVKAQECECVSYLDIAALTRLHHLDTGERPGGAAIIATEALTEDAWQPFLPGELRVYRDGALQVRHIAGRSDLHSTAPPEGFLQ